MIPHYSYNEFIALSNQETGKSVQYRKGCTRRVKQAYVYLHEHLQSQTQIAMDKIVITEVYHPAKDQYTGLIVHQGVMGTHPKYDVVYDGVCVNEYFNDIEGCIKNNIKEYNTHVINRKLDYSLLSEEKLLEESRNSELTVAKYELQDTENSNN